MTSTIHRLQIDRQMISVLPFAVALLFLSGMIVSEVSGAEVVIRRSDSKKLNGEIPENSKEGITLKPSKGEAQRIPADDVLSIQWAGEPSIIRSSRLDEAAGKTQKAFEGYQQALKELGEMQASLQAEAYFGIARTAASLAQNDKTKISIAIEKINEFQRKFPDSYHHWEAQLLLAQMQLLSGDAAAAQKIYEQAKASGLGSYVLAGELGLARVAMLKKDYEQALKSFEQVSKSTLKGSLMDRQRQEARLGTAECLFTQKKFELGIRSLDDLIEQTPPEEEKLLATAYLRRGDGFVGLGKTKEAVLSYLHVDVLFPGQAEADAEALYRLSQLWESLQHPERGIQAKDRLMQLYPNSRWAKSGAH